MGRFSTKPISQESSEDDSALTYRDFINPPPKNKESCRRGVLKYLNEIKEYKAKDNPTRKEYKRYNNALYQLHRYASGYFDDFPELIKRREEYRALERLLDGPLREVVNDVKKVINQICSKGTPFELFSKDDIIESTGWSVYQWHVLLREGIIPRGYVKTGGKDGSVLTNYYDAYQMQVLITAAQTIMPPGVSLRPKVKEKLKEFIHKHWGWRVYNEQSEDYEFQRLSDGASHPVRSGGDV